MLKKLTSGRFILTIIVGLVFAVVAIRGQMPPEAITGVIMAVIISYFDKKDHNNGN